MNSKLKIILISIGAYIISIFLAIISTGGLGYLYSIIFKTTCGGGLFIIANLNKGCKIEGFIYGYIFWLAIFAFCFFKQKTAWIVYLLGTFLFWAFIIYIIVAERTKGDFINSLLIMLILFVAGYLLAFGANKIRKKIS